MQNSEFQSFIDMNLAFVDSFRRRNSVLLLVRVAFVKSEGCLKSGVVGYNFPVDQGSVLLFSYKCLFRLRYTFRVSANLSVKKRWQNS
jgi:hypothetical protein